MATAPTVTRTPLTTSSGGRFAALDGLRGLAIAAVVAFHVTVMATRGAKWAGHEPPPAALWPLFAGKLGVDVFFVLSGFLVLRSWRNIRRSHEDLSTATATFARRRARRILPAFWFSLVVLIPFRAPEWAFSFEGLRNILMFTSLNQFLDPQLPHEVNVVTWTLTTEAHFYVLAPLLAFALVRYGASRVLPAVLVGTVAWRVMHGGTGEEAEWIFGRIDQFLAGMVASTLVERHDQGEPSSVVRFVRSTAGGWTLALVGVAAAAPLGVMQLLPKPLAYSATFHAVVGLVIAGIAIRVVSPERDHRLLSSAPLRILALASYSLYLWHWVVLIEASKRWGPSAPVLAAALAVTAVLTAVTYLCFERPFAKDERRPAPAEAPRGRLVDTRR